MSLVVVITLININSMFTSSVRGNTFYDFNEEIESITNELFTSLGLTSNFHLFENIQHLLEAHFKLRNISETNIEIYNIMKQVRDPYRKDIDEFLKIDQVLNELSYNGSYLTKETTFEKIQIDNIFENISSLVFSHNFGNKNFTFHINETKKDNIDSNESINESQEVMHSTEHNMDFIEDFLKKIDKLTINDFLDKESDVFIQKTRRFENNRYYDLKIWSKE